MHNETDCISFIEFFVLNFQNLNLQFSLFFSTRMSYPIEETVSQSQNLRLKEKKIFHLILYHTISAYRTPVTFFLDFFFIHTTFYL